MKNTNKKSRVIVTVLMSLLVVLFLVPILIVLMNSFKEQIFITKTPFSLPNTETFVGITNYIHGIVKVGFLRAFGYSLFITLFSVGAIVLFTSMAAWMITRVKSKFSRFLYFSFVFSMIVPFQMVMFTMSEVASIAHLDNPIGIILIYLGFGAGLSIFLFSRFIKSVSVEIEEAAIIDGCSPLQVFFYIVFPIIRPTVITVAILNTIWIWNDYLLPNLVIGNRFKTIPIIVQYLQGGKDVGAGMAILILSIIPIIVFYLTCRKYIIKGVISSAVKG